MGLGCRGRAGVAILCAALPLTGCLGLDRVAKDRATRATEREHERLRVTILQLPAATPPAAVLEGVRAYLALEPRDAVVWGILGNAARDSGDLEGADDAFRRALDIDPDSVVALVGRGLVAQDRGQLAEAAAEYREALARRPDSADAYMGLSIVALRRGEDRVALNYAETAFDLDDDNPVLAANLAIVYHYNGLEARRDDTMATATRLGYDKLDTLRQIFAGELTVR